MNNTIKVSELVHWFNAIRNIPDDQRTRALDAFWSGQLDSKAWLANSVDQYIPPMVNYSNVYIFGGWTGILANMLFHSDTHNHDYIRSIDIDPWCESVADTVNKIHEMNSWRFKAITHDMSTYCYEHDKPPYIVINTSSEHVDQTTYDRWYDNIPTGTWVIVQSNNYFSCSEHIRCCDNINQFIDINKIQDPVYIDTLHTDMYDRYMAIWIKSHT